MIVESRRGPRAESTHRVSVAVTDHLGRLVAHAGDAYFPTFLRSAAKPFQAMPILRQGAADHFDLTDPELALACSSHNSEPEQVERVAALLERIGCVESDLVCGPHRPLWRDLALSTETRGLVELPRSRLASNCSGKHTGMLALARHAGWPTAGYERPDHAVQRHCVAELAVWASIPEDQVVCAVDGCGVPCFSMPLERMARAFAALGASEDPAASRIRKAMMDHPDMVAGRGRLCTMLMRAYPGQVLAKVGAEGVYGAALVDRGLGIAIKVEDGDGWAASLALVAVLADLGLSPSPRDRLPAFTVLPIRNTRGDIVGEHRVAGSLAFD